ncbi:MAG: preprotein translocase subunit SecG [Bacillota bacterium]|nr:preprotein translocase subunit SecG [Bacillota bacterium]
MKTFLIVAQVVVAVVLVVSVLLQPSKTEGFGNVLSGSVDTFYSKNKPKTAETVLARITIGSAVLFAAVAIALNLV